MHKKKYHLGIREGSGEEGPCELCLEEEVGVHKVKKGGSTFWIEGRHVLRLRSWKSLAGLGE